MKDKRKNNEISIKILLLIMLILVAFFVVQNNIFNVKKDNKENINKITEDLNEIKKQTENEVINIVYIKELSWELELANKEHIVSEDYQIELKNIDNYRKIDARIYEYYENMMKDMKKDGIENIWVQSAYRSVEKQEELFYNKVKEYEDLGFTREEAEIATEKVLMRPGSSDHNLGLAIDFNYIDKSFEELEGFEWLQKNAENYGFVLRYPKEKEEITKVRYEPWHWRFVGIENARKMNEMNMCLEEYVEYLKKYKIEK